MIEDVGQLQVMVQRNFAKNGIDFYFRAELDNYLKGQKVMHRYAFGEPLVMSNKDVEEGELIDTAPSFTLSPHVARALMDELWHAGVRPTQEEGLSVAMAAQKAHLDDMRAIAFEVLSLKK